MTTLGDLRRKPCTTASRDYVREVQNALSLDADTAGRVADYVLREIQEEAAQRALPVMLLVPDGDATGPVCSWCHALGGLCWHVSHGAELREKEILDLHRAGALRRVNKEWYGPGGLLDSWRQAAADELHKAGHITATPRKGS